jgi:nucleoside-diphosphate-sugar epimerase
MPSHAVGVLGATSLVGPPLARLLIEQSRPVLGCSRNPPLGSSGDGMAWCRPGDAVAGPIPHWVALCPLWATVDAVDWLVQSGCTRLVALSSTSVLTKQASPDVNERRVAVHLAQAEEALATAARRAGIELVILRPTMVYDGHSDGNVARIAAFVRRFGCFPVCTPADGLRQPVHADDVAWACVAALDHDAPRPIYTISGAEALSFRDLVTRTCLASGLAPRLIDLPSGGWRFAALVGRLIGLPVTTGTASRMNEDLSFDHEDAAQDFGFRPRPFQPVPNVTQRVVDGSPLRVAP